MTNVREAVLETIRLMPDVSAAEIIDLNPDLGANTIKYEIKALTAQGRFIVSRKPSPHKYGRRYVKSYSIAPKAPTPTINLAELEELRAFKAQALERYPELATPPIIFKARERVAEHCDDDKIRTDILAGLKDNCLPMRVAVALLEEAA